MKQRFDINWIEPGLAELLLLNKHFADTDEVWEAVLEKWGIIKHFYDDYPDSLLRCGGQYTCAFCLMYGPKLCEGCPIVLATEYDFCAETPYEEYTDAIDEDNPWAAHQAATEELAFLKSLHQEYLCVPA